MAHKTDNADCPNCGEIGSYEGKARSGNNWTGTSYWFRYCSDCDIRYKYEATKDKSPTI